MIAEPSVPGPPPPPSPAGSYAPLRSSNPAHPANPRCPQGTLKSLLGFGTQFRNTRDLAASPPLGHHKWRILSLQLTACHRSAGHTPAADTPLRQQRLGAFLLPSSRLLESRAQGLTNLVLGIDQRLDPLKPTARRTCPSPSKPKPQDLTLRSVCKAGARTVGSQHWARLALRV